VGEFDIGNPIHKNPLRKKGLRKKEGPYQEKSTAYDVKYPKAKKGDKARAEEGLDVACETDTWGRPNGVDEGKRQKTPKAF